MKASWSIFRRALVVGTLCMTIAAADTASACAIPVFRYALERWAPGVFEVAVLHRGALGDADQQCVDRLRAAVSDQAKPANLRVITVDLDRATRPASTAGEPVQNDPAAATADVLPAGGPAVPAELAAKFADLKSPQLLLHYPAFGPERWLAWSGPLNAENVQRVADSPLRQQVIERVLAGDSAVWILIDSGDAQKDAEAETLLRAELARLEEKLKLPPRELLEAEQEFQPDTQVELRIGFSLFRLRRDDPSEQVFLSMLLNSEPDLAEFNEPMAIPIFGRGRTFFALVGKGISPENIADNCQFICSDCSCQVKEQNPGTDLLMAVNWDQQVKGSAFPDVPLPELTGIGGLEAIASQSLADASPAATNQSPTTTPPQRPVDAPSSSPDNGDAPDTADNQLLASADQNTAAVVNPSRTTARGQLPPPVRESTAAPDAGQFGGKLLIWTVGGAALAAVVIAGGSLWMRRRQPY